MPRRLTMGTIVTRAKQAADLETDDSIASAIWKWFASMVYGELWPEASLGAQKRYFETSTTITATGATGYTEPTDHFATVRVTRVDASGKEYELRELRTGEEVAYKGRVGEACGWTLVDDQLVLHPKPSSGSYKWYYQQQPTDLSAFADADVVDVIVPAGEPFMIWGVAAMALARQQKNVQLALQMKEQARAQVQWQASNRNATEVRTRGPVEYDDDDLRAPGDWDRWP